MKPAPALMAILAAAAATTAHAALTATTAYADDVPPRPKKLADLDDKAKRPAADRAKLDQQLAKRIGKPVEPIVNIRNGWTDETLVVDAKPGATVDQATMDRFLRCHFTNQHTHVDLRLIGVLVGSAMHFKSNLVYVVSGFRAPKYNLMLRKKGREVARNSQHSEGTAVDFKIPGVRVKDLHRWVKSLRLGGVGIYPESQFVHADTGPVRYWTGQ
jgi:uncharacterized protein YcbK (DUF882 family)